ncbi:TfoX/Sxy family protein [Hyphomonas sp.]|uniref:TfoX/Sxy family protein n=1 Tax=Hyphomonas sp. TaxID=87 RepID=UPI00391BC49F
MAKPPDPFHEFVAELFAPMGPVSIRRMFGGAGVFRDGLMFALLGDDTIYLKTDAALRADLEAEGCAPFLWTKPSTGEEIDMGYVSLPSSAMDDPDEASQWGKRALAAAKAKAAAKPVPRKKKT